MSLQVLLVSSRNHAGEWTVPGGGLEPRESGAMAAEREALEEVCLSVCLSVFLPVCVCLSVCLYVYLCLSSYLSVHMSI